LGRAGVSAGVPISGKSAIDVEQPPTGSASSSAPATNAMFTRRIEIKPCVPSLGNFWRADAYFINPCRIAGILSAND
jgi:hypothetical protein